MTTVKWVVQSWMLEASLEEKIPRWEDVSWHALHNELPVSDGGTAFWSAQVLTCTSGTRKALEV